MNAGVTGIRHLASCPSLCPTFFPPSMESTRSTAGATHFRPRRRTTLRHYLIRPIHNFEQKSGEEIHVGFDPTSLNSTSSARSCAETWTPFRAQPAEGYLLIVFGGADLDDSCAPVSEAVNGLP
jgi:hypothetical protein